jgi:hypothetical protein
MIGHLAGDGTLPQLCRIAKNPCKSALFDG